MVEFVCAGCGAVLSAPVERVVLPDHAHQKWGNGVLMPVLMRSGTYAVDPRRSGPPWLPWEAVDEAEAAAHGVLAPVHSVPLGAAGAVVLAPGDVRGTVLVTEWCAGYCCGLDGSAGPNLACAGCGRAVGARIDDCSLWQSVRLEADAVRAVGSGSVPSGWARALADARWEEPPGGAAPGPGAGAWPRASALEGVWEAAEGAALAHLVVAGAGVGVVCEGAAAVLFSAACEALLPAGDRGLRTALAGPGLGVPDADVLVVPVHPQTGEVWRPGGGAPVVPLAAGAWAHLALPGGAASALAWGRAPEPALLDEVSVGVLPHRRFRPDRGVFLDVLARLPRVREPVVRAVYERVQVAWDAF
ncbi:hypothetical protein [Nocardiopsis sp. NPDC057823]|uniref:hypothetical protein n=1 Tax=Nocardiopsis sp. NPDC057823 TaxID=3346256 RepID=UPI0036707AD1